MTRIRLQPEDAYKRKNETTGIENSSTKVVKGKETEINKSKKLSVITYSVDDLIQAIENVHAQNMNNANFEPFLNLNLQLLKHIQAKKGKINVGFKFETSNKFASDKAILTLKGE